MQIDFVCAYKLLHCTTVHWPQFPFFNFFFSQRLLNYSFVSFRVWFNSMNLWIYFFSFTTNQLVEKIHFSPLFTFHFRICFIPKLKKNYYDSCTFIVHFCTIYIQNNWIWKKLKKMKREKNNNSRRKKEKLYYISHYYM